MYDFFRKIIAYLTDNNIPYMLSGSVAMSVYVVPRATRDFDFIIHLLPKDIEAFAAYFKEGYYCDIDAIRDAVNNKGMFNIIDHTSGFKADFVILKSQEFRQVEFNRRKQSEFLDMDVSIVSVEDLLLSKLIWIQDLQSGLQIEDIKTLKTIENLEWDYINEWVKKLELNTFNLF